MADFALVGNKKHGCLIDNHKQVIIYYDHLSLYEKLKKKDSEIIIKYSDIESIKVCYGISTGVRFDSAQITLEVHTIDNHQYDFQISYELTVTDDLKSFINLLLESGLTIEDQYNLLNLVLTTDQNLLDLIKEVSHYK